MDCTTRTGCLLAIFWATFTVAWAYSAGPSSAVGTPGTIAFEGVSGSSLQNGDVYVVHADGSGLLALTHDRHSHHPTWSPDGRQILFIHDAPSTSQPQRSGPYELWVMDRDGSNAHVLRHLEYTIFSAAWSPDGDSIAVTYIPRGWAERPHPAFQPIPPGLFLFSARNDNQPRLLFRDGWNPAWSPDSKKIAFTQHADNHWAVHVAESDGSHDIQLTNPNIDAGSPAWSPDGKQIAFDFPNGKQTFIVDSDGSHKRQLTNDPAWECQQPSWSPDGKQITVWCMSARPACAAGVGGVMRQFPPCFRRVFVISATDPHAKLQQLTEETGLYPQFAPVPK